MAGEETDANTGVEETTETESSSAEVTYEPIIDADGFVSTLDFKEVKPEPVKTDTSETTEQKTESQPSEKKDFNEHPRFKELIQEKNELKARLEKLETDKAPKEPAKETPKSKYNFQNIMAMEDDAIMDQLTNKPKAFIQNLAAQMAHEIRMDLEVENQQRSQVETQRSMQEKTNATMATFFEDKPDGIEMLRDGRIEKFLRETPGHNPISAYYKLTEGNFVPVSKLEEALKQERDKIYKELKAAGKASSISSEPASKASEPHDGKPAKSKAELKQTMLKRALSRLS